MTIMKLIDKDAIVAEIERRISTYKRHYEELARYEVWNDAKKIEPKINELENLLSFLNTIEVKDTDAFIEKAADKFKQFMYDQHFFEGMVYQDAIIENLVGYFKTYMEGE